MWTEKEIFEHFEFLPCPDGIAGCLVQHIKVKKAVPVGHFEVPILFTHGKNAGETKIMLQERS